jgi:hypothetical protein
VLADSWYASAENINHLIGLNHHCIFALEASRTVALSEKERKQGKFQSLDAGPQTRASTRVQVFPDRVPLRVYLRSVQVALLLTRRVFTNKDGSRSCLYLITSDTTLSYEQIQTIYQRRWNTDRIWSIEEYHKSLKQNPSFEESATKNPDTQSNHFFASMLACIKLEALKLKHSLGHFRIKAKLYTAGHKAMHKELTTLKSSKLSA